MIGPRSVHLQYETNAMFYRRIWIDPCNLEPSMLLFKRGAPTDQLPESSCDLWEENEPPLCKACGVNV